MADQHETDAFKVMREDGSRLMEWTVDHRKEHTADTELLSSILDKIDVHQSNHHGHATAIRQAGSVTVLAGLVVAAGELLRLFLG